MISIRIAIASLLTAGALAAGGLVAQHEATAATTHHAVAGPVRCCNSVTKA